MNKEQNSKRLDFLLINPPGIMPLQPVFIIARTLMPMGLLYLGSVLEKDGFRVKILDLAVERYPFLKLKRILNKENPKFVGVTSNTSLVYNAYRTLGEIKKHSTAITILGGNHVTFTARESLRECVDIDIVVIGEGEKTILDIANNPDLSSVAGIAYRNDEGEIRINEKGSVIMDLDELPFPARHLLNHNNYHIPNYGNITMISTSRGCPFRCDFCVTTEKEGRLRRTRSVNSIIREMNDIARNFPDVKTIFFIDDNFLLDRNQVKSMCEKIKSSGLNNRFKWFCPARVGEIDEDIVKLMKSAGCSLIYLCVESTNQQVLNNIGKGTSLSQIKTAVDIIERHDIDIMASYILGVQGESEEDIKNTLEFSKELNTLLVQFGVLTPFPGSPFYRKVITNNLLTTRTWNDFNTIQHVFRNSVNLNELDLLRFYFSYWFRRDFYKKNSKKRIPFIFMGPLFLFYSYLLNKVRKKLYGRGAIPPVPLPVPSPTGIKAPEKVILYD